MDKMKKIAFAISISIAAAFSAGSGELKAVSDINAKVAQLNMDTADLDDVIRIFGEPIKYLWAGKTFTKDNLPSTYIAVYPNDFHILISHGKISELRFEGPRTGYTHRGKLKVGSSLDEVLEVVGRATKTIEGQTMPGIAADCVLYKDIGGRKGYCYYGRQDQRVRFFFLNYKLSALYVTSAVAKRPAKTIAEGKERPFQDVHPVASVKKFDDVRWKDMSKLNLSDRKGLIATLRFNQKTVWPESVRMPLGETPQILLKDAMNPGLGVLRLHQQGITGKGINIAIIDQPMYLDHPEFAGKIVAYHDTGCGEQSSMHGPAVTSLLVGTNCGTAPDARLYYAAVPSWKRDTAYEAKGLNWIIEQNKKLPASEKIRLVSVSAVPSGPGAPRDKNQRMWDEACTRAEAAGILVLDCTSHRGFIGPCWYDSRDPENVTKCTPGFRDMALRVSSTNRLLVPTCPRTSAEQYDRGKFSYVYWGSGGLSWAIPYCAGVLAMGWQVNPDLGPEKMRYLLFASAYETRGGTKVINPKQFIQLVKKAPQTSKN